MTWRRKLVAGAAGDFVDAAEAGRSVARGLAAEAVMSGPMGGGHCNQSGVCATLWPLPIDAKEYGTLLSRKVLEHQEDIDAKIVEASSHWNLERIAIVDRLIICCAAAELMYFPDIPTGVAINEAVDIAKKFSTGESSRFVNGVLDAIAKSFPSSIQRNP